MSYAKKPLSRIKNCSFEFRFRCVRVFKKERKIIWYTTFTHVRRFVKVIVIVSLRPTGYPWNGVRNPSLSIWKYTGDRNSSNCWGWIRGGGSGESPRPWWRIISYLCYLRTKVDRGLRTILNSSSDFRQFLTAAATDDRDHATEVKNIIFINALRSYPIAHFYCIVYTSK